MSVINFITEHWDSLVIVISASLALGLLYYKGQKTLVYKILYSLVTEAEAKFGGGTGELKQSTVIYEVYRVLPGFIKTFISVERLGKWVDDALDHAKEKWKGNSNVSGYIEGNSKSTESRENCSKDGDGE